MTDDNIGRLVLGRRIGETVVVNDNITITVTEINHGTVKLAFDAPKDVPIHRKEIHDRLKDQNRRHI